MGPEIPSSLTPHGRAVELTPDLIDTAYISEMAEAVGRGYVSISEDIAPRLLSLSKQSLPLPPVGQIEERLALRFLNGGRLGPVQLVVSVDLDEVVVELPTLHLFASGGNYYEALDGLQERLDMLAYQYMSTPDARLTPGGLRLKKSLSKLLTS